jgi:iron complex outermembrane recepter protein
MRRWQITQKSIQCCLCITFSGYQLIANTAEPALSEADYFPTDIPVVLSASRLKQTPAEAPVALTVIDRQMIEASGFTEIPDLLRLVPGFIVDYDSGNVQVAGYHFLPDVYVRQQQVLIDGRSVYTPILGGVPWTDLPFTIDDIERIEVIRGPNAVTYGSNSFLGVINIITRHPAVEQGSMIKANLGTHDLREGFFRHSGTSSKLDYRFSLAYRSDNGFENRFDNKIVRLFNTALEYQIDNFDSINFQAGYNEGPRGDDDVLYHSAPDFYRNNTSQFQQIRWENKQNVDEGFHLQFYHNRTKENSSYILPTSLGDYYADEGRLAERYDIEAEFTGRTPNNLRYVMGASYRQDRVASVELFGTYDSLDSHYRRVFAQFEQPLADKLLINYGLMIENNDLSGTAHSPRVALNYRLANSDTVRVTVSKATRTPIMVEAHPDTKILVPGIYYDQSYFDNNAVGNERITAYDIGLISARLNNTLHYDVRVFHEQIRGLIGEVAVETYPDDDGRAKYFANLDDILLRGIELQCNWNITTTTRLHGGFSHIKINSENIGDTSQYSDATPLNSLNLLFMHKMAKDVDLSLGIYHRSSMKPIVRRSFDPLTMPASTRVDMRLAEKFRLAGENHTIALILQNILDESYFARQENVIDRRGYVSYKIEF